MSADPIVHLARLRIIRLSQELETHLADKRGGGVALEILRRLRERAAVSLAALATCDSEEPKIVRALQNEVKRYDEWLAWLREIVQEGIAYDREVDDDERNELIDLLTQTPEGQREAINLGLINLEQDEVA